MTIQDRIKTAREGAGLSQTQLAEYCGVKPQAVSQWESGSTKSPKPDHLFAISKATGYSHEWLITGKGPQKATAVNEGRRDYKLDSNISPGPGYKRKLPLISFVQAGDLCQAEDPYPVGEAEEWKDSIWDTSEHAFMLRVDGDSMWPEFRDGEIIVVEPQEEAMHGDDVIARTPDGRATFKRLQITSDGMHLMALNPDWPERIVKVPPDTRICGVVIGSFVDRKRR